MEQKRKTKIIALSMPEEVVQQMDAVAAEVNLTRSEMIRRCIIKIAYDDKMRSIIKRGYLPTWNNAHSDNSEKKKKPGDQPGQDSSSLDPKKNIPQNKWYVQTRFQMALRAYDQARGTVDEKSREKEFRYWNEKLKECQQ